MHGLILTGFPTLINKAYLRRTLGSYRIATYLRERGWDIEVLDFITGWNLEQLQEFTRSRVNDKTVFIGFGATFPVWSDTLADYFKWVKETYPHIKVIAGGQVSNMFKIEADWYVDGYGERALEELLKHITGQGKVKYQLGINGRKVIKANLDYPSYPMKSLRVRYEDRDFIRQDETLVVEIGRGCRFKCSFCNFPILGVKDDHTRDAEDYYEELLENYERFGVTRYLVADETVNDYTEKLQKFAAVTKKLPFRPQMVCYARADLLVSRPEDWDLMIEMGLIGHHYGIESVNPKTLKAIGKGMDPNKLLPKLLDAKTYFKKHSPYKGQISLIAGLPYDTEKTLREGLDWCKENWRTEAVVFSPLYIPKATGGDNASELTSDWAKYGYRETKEDLYPVIDKYFRGLPTQWGVGEALANNTGLSWENDEWNVAKATQLVAEFYGKESIDNFGPVIWSLGEWEEIFRKPLDFFMDKTYTEIIKDLGINTGFVETFELMGKEGTKVVNEYIKNKLNWVNP